MSKRTRAVTISLLVAVLVTWVYPTLPHSTSKETPVISARTKATMEEKRENKRIAREYSRALGYSRKETACLITLWTRESRFDHFAKPKDSRGRKRSTAYGIAQLLGERSGDPAIQVLHGLRYIGYRYGGSACRALAHHRRGWY